MIDENKLLKDLKEASECKRIDDAPSDYFKLSELEFLISTQEKIKADEWISVSERLPTEEARYPVTMKNINSGKVSVGTKLFTQTSWVYDSDAEAHRWRIIAWKPLPEHYKESDTK